MIRPFKTGEPLSEVLSEARLGPIADAINQLWESVNTILADRQGAIRHVLFKVTGAVAGEAGRFNGTVYAPTALASSSGNLAESDLGEELGGASIGLDYAAIYGTSSLSTGDIVPGRVIGLDDESRRIVLLMTSSADDKLVPVSVSQTGGDAGSATTACTFTYDWTDPDGEEHTGTAPIWHRQDGRTGAYIAGEYGLARKVDGEWVLVVVDETFDADGTADDGGYGGGGGRGDTCCEDAPCECPEDVTGASVFVSGHFYISHTTHGLICDSDFVLEFAPNADEPPVSCQWDAVQDIKDVLTIESGQDGNFPAQVTFRVLALDTVGCKWAIEWGFPMDQSDKTVGRQPMGLYNDASSVYGGYTFTVTEVEVTE